MVKEAEENAAEDAKRKEEAEVRNSAEQQSYSIEKLLDENKDKLDDSVTSEVRAAAEAVKEALKGDDVEAIKSAQEELNTKAQKIGEALYAQAQQEGAPGAEGWTDAANAARDAEDDVVDAEIVDDEDSKN